MTEPEKTCLIYIQILATFSEFQVQQLFSEHDATYTPIIGGSAKTYRIITAYQEKELHNTKHTGFLCRK